MAKKRAKAFDLWEDVRIELGLTREQLAKESSVDLKWLNDFVHVGVFHSQVAKIKRIERRLGLKLPSEYYESPDLPNLREKEWYEQIFNYGEDCPRGRSWKGYPLEMDAIWLQREEAGLYQVRQNDQGIARGLERI